MMLMKTRFLIYLAASISLWVTACSGPAEDRGELSGTFAPIVPAYADSIVIPVNMAPLNFAFHPDSVCMEKAWVVVRAYDSLRNPRRSDVFGIRRTGGTKIPSRKWKRLLSEAVGGYLSVEISFKSKEKHVRYEPLHWFVSPDQIDKYLLYRVSQYEEGRHGDVFMVQYDLENCKTRLVGHNRLLDYDGRGQRSCMNCHDCLQNDSRNMVFHVRGNHKGTIVMRGDTLMKIALPDNYDLRLTYPAWHPSGKIVAFSTNLPTSVHYASSTRKIIYTLDTLGSIVLLDVEKMRLFSCPQLTDTAFDQVFPAWSPDGRHLYFCRSPKKRYGVFPFPRHVDSSLSMRQNRTEQVWDDLMRISFDLSDRSFSDLRCVYPFSLMQKSASMPKVSKDGRYLVLSLLKTSTFPLQDLGDFYRLDLHADTLRPLELKMLNTPGSEKGHSFSSTGRWMVFSSSRRTLVIPETYVTRFDAETGTFSKPFLVPRARGDFYLTNLQGFVFPVLSTVPVRHTAHEVMGTARSEAVLVDIDTSLSCFRLESGKKSMLRGGH